MPAQEVDQSSQAGTFIPDVLECLAVSPRNPERAKLESCGVNATRRPEIPRFKQLDRKGFWSGRSVISTRRSSLEPGRHAHRPHYLVENIKASFRTSTRCCSSAAGKVLYVPTFDCDHVLHVSQWSGGQERDRGLVRGGSHYNAGSNSGDLVQR